MKVTILEPKPDEEDEIIIKCANLDENLLELIRDLKQGSSKLNVYRNSEIFRIEPEQVYYFESVDQKVFAYCRTDVFEIKSKLYELEEELPKQDFIRAAKSIILNLNKIKSLTPAFGGRFEALLKKYLMHLIGMLVRLEVQ